MQIAIAPLFGEGFASPFNDALDLAVAAILIKLLGFHWAFLPTLAAEAMPVLDLAPTWTATVLLVTGCNIAPDVTALLRDRMRRDRDRSL